MYRTCDGEALDCVRAAVCRVLELPEEDVEPGSRLVEDLGADSLALVEIAELAEEAAAWRWRVPVRIDDVGLTVARTTGDLARDLAASLTRGEQGRTVSAATGHDMSRRQGR